MRLICIVLLTLCFLPSNLQSQKIGDSYDEAKKKLEELGYETETSILDNKLLLTYKHEWFTKKVGTYEILWGYIFTSNRSGDYIMRGFYSIHPREAFDEVYKSLKKYKSVGDMEWIDIKSNRKFYVEMHSDYIQVTGAPL